MHLGKWFLTAILVCAAARAGAQEITVAAAADLQAFMQQAVARFQGESKISVKVIYGSSGNFFQQLQNGAPFDVFFSANLDFPRKLEAAGLAEPDTFYLYAVGKIVLWVPRAAKLDIRPGLASLRNPAIGKIAIANPQHAPYGQAAVAALKREGVYDQIAHKLVLGENVSQAASFMVAGAADAGVIPLSLALSPSMKDLGTYVEIPPGEYPPIEQACVVLKSSKQKEAAKAFLRFLKTPAMTALFHAYGFTVPADSPAR